MIHAVWRCNAGFNSMHSVWDHVRAKHGFFMITPSLSVALVLLWRKLIPSPHLNKKKKKKSNERNTVVSCLTPQVINILAQQFLQSDFCKLIPKMVISSFVLPLVDGSHVSEIWCRSRSDGGGELIKEKSSQVSLVRLTLAKARATFSEPAPSVTSDLIRGTTLNSGCEVS